MAEPVMADTAAWDDGGETAVVDDVPTAAAAGLAWSSSSDDELLPIPPASRSWRLAAGIAAGVVVGAGLLAGSVGFTAWMLHPSSGPAAGPAAPVVTSTETRIPKAAVRPIIADPDATDERFLAELQRVKITIVDRTSTVFQAHWVCGEFQAGKPRNDVVAAVKARNTQLTELGTSDFVDDAVAFYCPQYQQAAPAQTATPQAAPSPSPLPDSYRAGLAATNPALSAYVCRYLGSAGDPHAGAAAQQVEAKMGWGFEQSFDFVVSVIIDDCPQYSDR